MNELETKGTEADDEFVEVSDPTELPSKNFKPDIFPPVEEDSVPEEGEASNLDTILDIPVNMVVELGRTDISVRNLINLEVGSVIEMDGMAGEPMDVLINGGLIAQGEVVVVNDRFGIRLTDVITPSERLRRLHKNKR